MKAKLILEDGTTFQGKAFGYLKDGIGELVFNTSMSGYQELITDPSYKGQILVLTYPLIGNYGINLEDMESEKVQVGGLVIREKAIFPNNFRCEMDLDNYLKQNKVIGIEGIDTRYLTKILKTRENIRGLIVLEDLDEMDIRDRFKNFQKGKVQNGGTESIYTIEGKGKHIGVLDFGEKNSTIKSFKDKNCKLTIFPKDTDIDNLLNKDIDLIYISNGSGDPFDFQDSIDRIREIVGKKPIVASGLGHEILTLALDGEISKLDHGHRGSNYPVKDLGEDLIYITSQNHRYKVDKVPAKGKVSYRNVNDNTIEGIKYESLRIYSIAFSPEIGEGPKPVDYIIDEFLKYAL